MCNRTYARDGRPHLDQRGHVEAILYKPLGHADVASVHNRGEHVPADSSAPLHELVDGDGIMLAHSLIEGSSIHRLTVAARQVDCMALEQSSYNIWQRT